jgi:hypothetical protein
MFPTSVLLAVRSGHSLVGDEVSILKPIKGYKDDSDVLMELGLIVARRRVCGLVGLDAAANKEHDVI